VPAALDRITALDAAVADLEARIAAAAADWQREIGLLKAIPGSGDIVAWAWIAEIGPAPHQWFTSHHKLASRVSLAPGSNVSAGKRKYGRTGDAGTYIKPVLIQAARAATRVRGPTAGPVQPAGTPPRRPEEPGRDEEGHPWRSRTPCSRSPTPS
jgi:transposase